MEERDLVEETGAAQESRPGPQSAATQRLTRKMTDAPARHRPMIEKVVEDLLDGMRRLKGGR